MALVSRIAALTELAPVHHPEPLPSDLQPPDDAHLLPPVPARTSATNPADVPPGNEDAPFDPDYDTPPPASPPRYLTPDPFTLTGAVDAADDADYLLEQHFWATAVVGRDRLIELNTQATAFFTDHYSDAWAPGYLRDRLGTDLTADPRFTPGHAPAGWTALVDHLRGLGATDTELLGAGLAQRARTGALIDRFRDRLTLPIHDAHGAIVGFIARRNSAAADDGRTGPKYLNTPGTDLNRKGEHLFGLHETQSALAAGATPAVVEGPLDAIALTLAGGEQIVGIATLGTALTDRQADLLGHYIRADGSGILVATNNDLAGQQAAERIYWQLTSRGDARAASPYPRDSIPLIWSTVTGPAVCGRPSTSHEASPTSCSTPASTRLYARAAPRTCTRHCARSARSSLPCHPAGGRRTSIGSPRHLSCRPALSTGPCSTATRTPRHPAGARLVPNGRPARRPPMTFMSGRPIWDRRHEATRPTCMLPANGSYPVTADEV